MKRILMQTIRHEQQRYPTVGDYQEGHGFVVFSVSDMGNPDYEALVLLHEFVEYLLIKKRGIAVEAIDAFDQQFEAARTSDDDSEPGHDPSSPYHREHLSAEIIERQVAQWLGVDWDAYSKIVSSL